MLAVAILMRRVKNYQHHVIHPDKQPASSGIRDRTNSHYHTRITSVKCLRLCIAHIRFLLNRILLGNVQNNIVPGISGCFTKPLPPHKFVQVRWQLISMTSLHSLQFQFGSILIRFYVLRMNSSDRIDEVLTVPWEAT